MNYLYLEILAIFILILANGFFSLAEFSIIASRKSRLKGMVKKGSKAAARALKLQNKPETFLATVQVGITFVGMLAGVFSGATLVEHIIPLIRQMPVGLISGSARPIAYVLTALAISFFSVILGELIPKYLALSRPAQLATTLSGPISVMVYITYVPIKILTWTAKAIMRIFGFRTRSSSAVNEEEINLLISEGRERGVFDETEEEIISSVFDFSDITARQAMTPRTNIVGIEVNDDTEKILETVASHGYSRFPVYTETLDNIAGIIYTKDIIRILQHSDAIVINDIIRKPLFVPDSQMLNTLLRTFQHKRVHMAIVLDEFGGTAGLITLEDLLEEIVGEIQDEHDSEQKEFVMKSNTLAFAAGSLRPDELNHQFDTSLPEDEYETIGGMIFEVLGRPAVKGDEIRIENIKFRVLEVEGNRIQRIKIEKIPQKK